MEIATFFWGSTGGKRIPYLIILIGLFSSQSLHLTSSALIKRGFLAVLLVAYYIEHRAWHQTSAMGRSTVFKRNFHSLASSLHAVIIREAEGASCWKITSFLCFQICQQTSSTMHSECFAGTDGGRFSSQIVLAVHLSVMYPRRVQIWRAKGQSSSRCVQVSRAALQSSQTGSSTIPFLWRLSRHCSLSCTSSQAKNWTCGGARLSHTNL